MFLKRTFLDYPLLLIKSIGKKSFEGLGQVIKKSGDTIARRLMSAEKNFIVLEKIAQNAFKNTKKLTIVLDDTLIKKPFSTQIMGVGYEYDTKLRAEVLGYRTIVCGATKGKIFFPLECKLLFPKEVRDPSCEDKNTMIKKMILRAMTIFPDKILNVAFDGLFATKELLQWASKENIRIECRMHSNRVVSYKGTSQAIRDIKDLKMSGRKKARTIVVSWNGIDLFITAHRRIDKNKQETTVYQASTYKDRPLEHVNTYKKRWAIEMFFRTVKQSLGLQDCFSTKITTQFNHISSVLVAYSLIQQEKIKRRFKCPEDAIRNLKRQNFQILTTNFYALNQIFLGAYA